MLRIHQSETEEKRGTGMRGVLDALRRIVRDLRLGARETERTAGISAAQLFVLQTLADVHASSLNDLALRTMTDQSSVSVVVRRLVERKLVSRKAAADDARRLELRLTPAGHRVLARCPEPTQAKILAALERLSPSELASLTEGLSALTREMGASALPPPMFFEDVPEPVDTPAERVADHEAPRRDR